MNFQRVLAGVCFTLAAAVASAQTGIGTFTPDPTAALHVKTSSPSQDPILLEGLRAGTTETDIVVTDANGKLRYRPIADLTVSGEWTYNGTNHIYANRARAGSGNTNVVVTNTGRFGIGTTAPDALFHISQSGDFVTSSGGGIARFGAGGNYLGVDENEIGAFESNLPGRLNLNVDGGEVTIGVNSGGTTLFHAYGRAQIEVLPAGDVDGANPTDDQIVTATSTGLLRKVPTSEINGMEWRNDASDLYIYAKRARDANAGNHVVVTDNGRFGIGTTTPRTKLDLVNSSLVVERAGSTLSGSAIGNRESVRLAGSTANGDGVMSTNDRFDFIIKNNATATNGGETFMGTSSRYASRIFFDGNNRTEAANGVSPGDDDAFGISVSTTDGTAGQNITWRTPFVVENSGQVGIGTTSPQAQLHVSGPNISAANPNSAMRITRSALPIGQINQVPATDPQVLLIDPDGQIKRIEATRLFDDEGEWVDATSGQYIYAKRARDEGATDFVVIDDDGRLGLGQTNPREKIHITNGGMRIDGQTFGIGFNNENPYSAIPTRDGSRIYHEGATIGTYRDALIIEKTDFNHDAVDGGIVFANRNRVDNRYTTMVIRGDGNVGIGQNFTAPTDRLHVVGNIQVQTGGLGNAATGGLVRTGDPYVSPLITNTLANGLVAADETDFAYFGTKREGPNRVDGVIVWGDDSQDNLRIMHGSGSGGVLTEAITVLGANRNVGIGVSLPSAKLHVGGTARIETLPAGDLNRVLPDDELVTADADGNLRKVPASALFQTFEDQDWTILSNGNIYNANVNNVGIGQINPQRKLHVGGNVRLDVLPAGVVNRFASSDQLVTADVNGDLRKVSAATLFGTFEDNDWVINGANIYNANSGSVGIGTTTPSVNFKLDVNGAINMRDGNYFQIGSNTNNRITAVSANEVTWRTNANLRFQSQTGTSDLMVISGNNQSIGIGVDPNSNLWGMDFGRPSRFRENTRLYFGNNNSVTGGNQNSIYNSDNDNFRVHARTLFSVRDRSDAANVFTVNSSNSRVGVREDNPQQELDINGRVRIQNLPVQASVGSADRFVITSAAGDLSKIEFQQFQGPWDRDALNARTFLRNNGDRVGMGTNNPTGKLHILESPGTPLTSTTGTIVLEHSDAGGENSILFKSRQTSSDYAYIRYQDDGSGNGTSNSTSLLTIGVENNTPGNSGQDDIAIMPSGNLGIGTIAPSRKLHVAGTARIESIPSNTTDLFAVTTDNDGNINKQAISSIKDNLGNHVMTQRLRTNGFAMSHDGSDAGMKLTSRNSLMVSNRFQLGNISPNWIDDDITQLPPYVSASTPINDGFAGNDGAVFAPVRTSTEDSDLRLYILDNPNDAFSIWGNPCGSSDCGEINNSNRVIEFQAGGQITIDRLAFGSGADQMVLADNRGRLKLGGVPGTSPATGGDNLGNHVATRDIILGKWRILGSNNMRFDPSTRNINLPDNGTITWGSIYGTAIAGDLTANGEGGNTDLKLEASDDIYMEAKGGQGDLILRATGDVDFRVNDKMEFRVGTDNTNDNFTVFTDDTVERFSVRNTGSVRVNGLADPLPGAVNRIVVAAPNGDLQVMSGSSTGLWDRNAGNTDTYLTNSGDEVGIGTNSPATKLHVSGTGPVNGTPVELRISNTSGGGQSAVFFQEGNSLTAGIRMRYAGNSNVFFIEDGSGTNPLMTFERTSRSTGIGTNNPDDETALHVFKASTDNPGRPTRLLLQNAAGDGSASVELMEGGGGIGANNGMALRYNATGTEAFEILRGTADMSNTDVKFKVERNSGNVSVRTLQTGGGQMMVVSDINGTLSTRAFDAALWSRTGANTFLANVTDQVGIGTSTPGAKLDVNGTVNIQGLAVGTATDRFVVADAITGRLRYRDASAFANFWSRAGNEVSLATSTDLVGIGVTPASGVKLHVGGSVRVDALSGGVTQMVVADALGNLTKQTIPVNTNYWSQTGNVVELVTASNNVGVGVTPATGTRLHTGSGKIRFDDLIGTGSRVVIADLNGELSSQPIGNFQNNWTRNSVTGQVQLAVNTDFVGIGTPSGPTAQLHTTGSVRFQSLANVGGQNVVTADANGNLSTRTLPSPLWERDAANQFTYAVNGGDRIGIGTSSPSSKLHVASGAVTITELPTNTGDENADRVVVTTASGELKSLPAGLLKSPWIEDLSNRVKLRANDNWVGIGTQTPLSVLHIEDDIPTATGTMEMRLQNRQGNGEINLRFRTGTNSGGFNDENNSMVLRYTNQYDALEVTNGYGRADVNYSSLFKIRRANGFVGINVGVANPTQRLHIGQGNLRLEDGDILMGQRHRIQFADPRSFIGDNGDLANRDLYVSAEEDLIVRGQQRIDMRTGTNIFQQAGDDFDIRAGTNLNQRAGNNFDLNVTNTMTLDAGGAARVAAGSGDLDLRGNRILFRRGGAVQGYFDTDGRLELSGGSATDKLDVIGQVRIRTLSAGANPGMVVADNNGRLSKQALPTFDNFWTRDGATNRVTTTTAGDQVVINGIGTGAGALNTLSRFYVNGIIQSSTLASTGTVNRMVVATPNGQMFTQPLPSFVDTDNQQLALSGTTLSLTNSASVNLAAFVNTDNQALSIAGNTLSLVNGGSVTLPSNSPFDATPTTATLKAGITTLSIGTTADPTLVHVRGTMRLETLPIGSVTDSLVTVDATGNLRRVNAGRQIGVYNGALTRNLTTGARYISRDGSNAGIYINGFNQVSINGLPSGANMLTVNGGMRVTADVTAQSLVTTNFRMGTTATAGYVLKTDAAGNGTWQPDAVASDERLKTHITPMTGTLDKVAALRTVSYQYKTGLETPGVILDEDTHYGLIAQDVAKVFPHAVVQHGGYLQLKYRELTGVLFAATNELRADNQALTARTTRLEAELAEIKAAKTELEREVHSLSAETKELQQNMTAVLRHIEAGKRVQAGGH